MKKKTYIPKYIEKPPIDAEVIELTKYRGVNAINIKMSDGRIEYFLTPYCIIGGWDRRICVGTKGKAQYKSGPSYGLWYFTPEF